MEEEHPLENDKLFSLLGHGAMAVWQAFEMKAKGMRGGLKAGRLLGSGVWKAHLLGTRTGADPSLSPGYLGASPSKW